MSYTEQVREFSEACNDELPNTPTLLPADQVSFIIEMVIDELDELREATTVVDQADALLDAIIYICDTAARHGMNLDRLFSIVHAANMSKIVDGKVIRRADGKVLKPEGWVAPEPQLEEGSFSSAPPPSAQELMLGLVDSVEDAVRNSESTDLMTDRELLQELVQDGWGCCEEIALPEIDAAIRLQLGGHTELLARRIQMIRGVREHNKYYATYSGPREDAKPRPYTYEQKRALEKEIQGVLAAERAAHADEGDNKEDS